MPRTPHTSFPPLSDEALGRPPAAWFPAVAAMLTQQAALCRDLEAFAPDQSAHVEAGRTDDLLGILNHRQPILDKLTTLSAALAPFHEHQADALARLSPAQRRTLQAHLDTVAQTLQRIGVSDTADRLHLEAQRTSVADELTGLARLRGAAAAYASPSRSDTTPRFHDRRA